MESKDIMMMVVVGVGVITVGATIGSVKKQEEKTERVNSRTERVLTRQEQRTCRVAIRKKVKPLPSYCQ